MLVIYLKIMLFQILINSLKNKLFDNENYEVYFLIEFILNLIVSTELRENLDPIIESLNINYVWMDNNEDLIDLFNFIKEKIINNKNINIIVLVS